MEVAITLDYELFGNGDGDVIKDIIEPTDKFLEICHEFNINITIFFEVVEYWKLKEKYESGYNMGYSTNPADLMSSQIKKAYKFGHDIQLHVHPQWLDAEYINNKWKVNNNLWRLSDLPELPNEDINHGLYFIFSRGKETLEDLIKTIDPNYTCQILRAGGFNVFPSANIARSMRKTGLLADSSVYAGGYSNSTKRLYDYRSIPNTIQCWSTFNDNLLDWKNEGTSTSDIPIYEFPIFAKQMRKYERYDLHRLKNKFTKRSSIRTNFEQVEETIVCNRNIKQFFEYEAVTFDYCLLSYQKQIKFIKNAAEIFNFNKNVGSPFTLIGHSKELSNFDNLFSFFSFIYSMEPSIKFVTLSECLNKR